MPTEIVLVGPTIQKLKPAVESTATDAEIGAALGNMHFEWQQADSGDSKPVTVTQSPAPKTGELKPWSEDDELAFQMGDVHGE